MKFSNVFICISLFSVLLFSCGKDGETGPEGKAGLKSLLDIQPLAPGAQCMTGGVSIHAGIDKNGNNKLESNEIENTQFICNGTNANSDKQVIIPLIFTDGVSFYANKTPKQVEMIPDFDITRFPGVDSAALFARVTAFEDYTGQPISDPATISLYNITDKTVIANSVITSIPGERMYDPMATFQHSENCFAGFPRKKISLGVELSCATGSAMAKDLYLILYRK